MRILIYKFKKQKKVIEFKDLDLPQQLAWQFFFPPLVLPFQPTQTPLHHNPADNICCFPIKIWKVHHLHP